MDGVRLSNQVHPQPLQVIRQGVTVLLHCTEAGSCA
jgi:hypothetical protein